MAVTEGSELQSTSTPQGHNIFPPDYNMLIYFGIPRLPEDYRAVTVAELSGCQRKERELYVRSCSLRKQGASWGTVWTKTRQWTLSRQPLDRFQPGQLTMHRNAKTAGASYQKEQRPAHLNWCRRGTIACGECFRRKIKPMAKDRYKCLFLCSKYLYTLTKGSLNFSARG